MKSIASRSVLFSLFSICKTTSEVLCLVWGSAGQGRKTMTHWCDFSGGHQQAGEGAGAHGIGEQADRTGSVWPQKRAKIAVCDNVIGRHRESKARFFLEINHRPERNRHKHEHGKFQLFYCENGQILEKVAQRGCNLFSRGNIQESTGHVPK